VTHPDEVEDELAIALALSLQIAEAQEDPDLTAAINASLALTAPENPRDLELEKALEESALTAAMQASYYYTMFDTFQEDFALRGDLALQPPLREEGASSPRSFTPSYSSPAPQSADNRVIEQCEKLGLLVTGRLQEIFGQPNDIHQYTRELGQICRDNFLAIDEKNNFTKAGELLEKFKVFRSELFECNILPNKVNGVRLILDSIENKGEAHIEPETGINMMSLFVKTWDLAKNSGYRKQYQQDVINVLVHNKITGGGCDAGIAARLIQLYTAFLYAEMKAHLGERIRVSIAS